MEDTQASPISQLLTRLGLTREDLQTRSDQMRQFLTADSRVFDLDSSSTPNPPTDSKSASRTSSLMPSSSAHSMSRARSSSFRDASPPRTPVKSEPVEGSLPSRPLDTMEAVIERHRQARREKRHRKGKERDSISRASIPYPSSPTPSNASRSRMSLDPAAASRDDHREDTSRCSSSAPNATDEDRTHSPPPLTPSQSKYYREHTASQAKLLPPKTVIKSETPLPTRTTSILQQPTPFPCSSYASQMPYLFKNPQASTSGGAAPVTPQTKRTFTPPRRFVKSTSSPVPESSPPSSPVRPVVNLVSSPGPMGPEPDEMQYENLPYKLPAGPYSPSKPDLSYAALLGQAILSSPEHRLTLQEIYDWITIVYPFFKRGETTWMNSIRHVLSTTVCFRKVTRDRALGRTLWAIWDEDLECFKDGGFRKQFCKDMQNASKDNSKRSRNAANEDDSSGGKRPAKRAKRERAASSTQKPAAAAVPSYVPAYPMFPPSRPTAHHQSYYEACAVQVSGMPAVMFPAVPLPGLELVYPHFPLVAAAAASSSAGASASETSGTEHQDAEPSVSQSVDDGATSSTGQVHAPSSASSSSFPDSLPGLTPNRSSSSPPPTTSELDFLKDGVFDSDSEDEGKDKDGDLFDKTKLTPVQFWGKSNSASKSDKPRVKLTYGLSEADEDEDDPMMSPDGILAKHSKAHPLLRESVSPTPSFRSRSGKDKGKEKEKDTGKEKEVSHLPSRLNTPPPIIPGPPSTPPRKISSSTALQLSPVRTPISHRGLHMSPSASLAYYKSHLDPPPSRLPFPSFPSSASASLDNPPSTPSRKPRKFLAGESPFRTPGSMLSPFRMSLYDPHDPLTLLDDELNRMGQAEGGSPSGLFGTTRSMLLYDSPGPSRGKWW